MSENIFCLTLVYKIKFTFPVERLYYEIIQTCVKYATKQHNSSDNNLGKNTVWHSLRLNAEVATKAWLILGSVVVVVEIALWVDILLFLLCLLKNLQKNSKLKMCFSHDIKI